MLEEKNLFCIIALMKNLIFLIIALIFIELSFETFAGSKVKVVDGDSLEMGNKRIRLIGIDAPEYFQECFDAAGKAYNCGKEAKKYLEDLVEKGQAKGQKVKCRAEDVDRYKRSLSECQIGDVRLNLEMVKAGWAVAYKDERYKMLEKRAKERKIGIWQGKFMRPELYRAIKRKEEEQKK